MGCGQTTALGRLPARGPAESERPMPRTSNRPGAASAASTSATDNADADRETAARPVPAGWVYPPGPRTKRMREYDASDNEFNPDSPGRPIGLVERRITEPGTGDSPNAFRVLVERLDPDIDDPLVRVTELHTLSDGTVSLTTVSSAKDEREGGDKRHFRYEPPLALAPPTLEPGEVYESSSEMIEYREDDPDSIVLRGDASRTFRTLSRDEIEQLFGADAPDLPGVLEVLEITIGPAKVDQRVARIVRRDLGAVRELDERTVRVFGFTTESRSVLLIHDEAEGRSAGD